jgi:hypothetical protein
VGKIVTGFSDLLETILETKEMIDQKNLGDTDENYQEDFLDEILEMMDVN